MCEYLTTIHVLTSYMAPGMLNEVAIIPVHFRPGVFGGEVSPEKGIYGSVIFF